MRAGIQFGPSDTAWGMLAVLVGVTTFLLPPALFLLLFLLGVLLLTSVISPYAALAALLVLSPLRTLIATEFTAPSLLVVDVSYLLFGITLASFCVYRILRDQPIIQWHATPVFIPIILFVAATCLSGLTAQSMSFWLSEWLKWVIVLIVLILILNLGNGFFRWEWLIWLVTTAAAANALIGIYIFLGGSGADHLLIGGRFFRAFGTFGQPNPFGGFMGLALPLSGMMASGYAYQLLRSDHRQRAHSTVGMLIVYYSAASLVIFIALLMSWSRGAWLSTMVAVIAIAFALPRRLSHSLSLLMLILVGVGVIWVSGALPDSIEQRLESSAEETFTLYDVRGVDITSENYAVVERLAHWQAALDMARANPWLGVGFGNYASAYPQYRLLNWKEPLGHAHNYYLNIFAEAGMIGALAYAALWGSVLMWTWKARKHPDVVARCAAVGLLGSWAYLISHSLLDNLYVNNLFLHISVLIGVLILLHNQVWKTVKVSA